MQWKPLSSHPAHIWRKTVLSYFFFIWSIIELKKTFSFTSEILGQLVNPLIRDDKYFHNRTENISLPIQMELSEKQKVFRVVFIKTLKFTLNFEHLKKNEPHSLSIFQIIHFQRRSYLKLALANRISQTNDRSGIIMKSLKLIINHCIIIIIVKNVKSSTNISSIIYHLIVSFNKELSTSTS